MMPAAGFWERLASLPTPDPRASSVYVHAPSAAAAEVLAKMVGGMFPDLVCELERDGSVSMKGTAGSCGVSIWIGPVGTPGESA